MYLHVFTQLKCKTWEIQLRRQVLKCSNVLCPKRVKNSGSWLAG